MSQEIRRRQSFIPHNHRQSYSGRNSPPRPSQVDDSDYNINNSYRKGMNNINNKDFDFCETPTSTRLFNNSFIHCQQHNQGFCFFVPFLLALLQSNLISSLAPPLSPPPPPPPPVLSLLPTPQLSSPPELPALPLSLVFERLQISCYCPSSSP